MDGLETWQMPFREAGILAHAIKELGRSSTPARLAKQYLRVIGNSVADNSSSKSTLQFFPDTYSDIR